MKRMKQMITAGALGLAILSTPVLALASSDEYGAGAAAKDTKLTLKEMLTYSLQDEYLAHAEYVEILDEFGSVRPFSNIVNAESRHIAMLLPLFKSHKLTAPADKGAQHVEVPTTLKESYAAGVEAEILNIAMYKRFLKKDLPQDVEDVFKKLKAASEQHLIAFQRAVDRGTALPKTNTGKVSKATTGIRKNQNISCKQSAAPAKNADRPMKGDQSRKGLRDRSCR